ncbi:hypothetical protein AB0M23_09115 [Streptomyces sp. NPDC052077]|uniref:hypothetical protein n=1 Tax=Streptomyces sp. NPDC052077 TaxID=3154757 RepID=UPI00342D0AF1
MCEEGAHLPRPDGPGGSPALDLAVAQGGFVETVFPAAGHHGRETVFPAAGHGSLADRDTRRAEGGARGTVEVRRPARHGPDDGSKEGRVTDTVGPWQLVRFLHVTGAVLWVGGQLALSLLVLPLARRLLEPGPRDRFAADVGRRFGILTGALFLPLQLGTGWAIAWHKGVGWASLAEPGYGRTLAAKLGLFAVVMLLASAHGLAHAKGRPRLARALAVASLAGSVGVVLLATALPAT